jgi:hypothetical protein
MRVCPHASQRSTCPPRGVISCSRRPHRRDDRARRAAFAPPRPRSTRSNNRNGTSPRLGRQHPCSRSPFLRAIRRAVLAG